MFESTQRRTFGATHATRSADATHTTGAVGAAHAHRRRAGRALLVRALLVRALLVRALLVRALLVGASLTLMTWANADGARRAAAATPQTTERPNLLLLVTDDQRWDALGAEGNPHIETPHLDRLAARGVRFTESFVTTSICAINRACLLTGQYASRHGIHDFAAPLLPEQFAASFPARLRADGYRTGFVGKWGLGGPLPGGQYDFWRGYAGQGNYFEADDPTHLTDRLTDAALEFLDGCSPRQPFCLQVSFKAPHVQDRAPRPFQPAARYESRYAEVVLPEPITADADFAALPEFLQTSEGRVRWQTRFATSEMYQQSVKDYYRLMTGVDDAVAAILGRLAARGLDEQTVVVFTSDNGFFLGEYGLAGKWLMYEESIRVPLVVVDPRLPVERRGTTCDRVVLTIDVAPTLLELAGSAIPGAMQGQSLVPLVDGDETPWRDGFFYEHRFVHARIPPSEGYRLGRWKYVRYLHESPPPEQLFDLESEAGERVNRVDDPQLATVLAELRERCDRARDAAR